MKVFSRENVFQKRKEEDESPAARKHPFIAARPTETHNSKCAEMWCGRADVEKSRCGELRPGVERETKSERVAPSFAEFVLLTFGSHIQTAGAAPLAVFRRVRLAMPVGTATVRPSIMLDHIGTAATSSAPLLREGDYRFLARRGKS